MHTLLHNSSSYSSLDSLWGSKFLVMEEKGYSESREDSLCAMYFGVSCTFFALIKNFSNQVLNDQRCSETRDNILQEIAHMLGLLLWRRIQEAEEEKRIEKQELIHKLEEAKKEIMELKLTRSEDAKANEKVASIYAAQEQSWFTERRKLKNQVGSLLNDLRILDKRKNETISELSRKVGELEDGVKSKEKVFEEEENKRKELEEKLKSTEVVLEELKEKNKVEAQEHSSELLKHKKAFIELVSNQRQLEAELGRASRQVEAAKQRLEYLFDEKEEAVLMVEELSVEIERMGKESEKKDKILSAMMRKIKLDSPEKQMTAKDLKFYKPKKKMGERRTEKFGSFPASRSERHTLRSFLSRQVSSRLLEVFPDDEDDDDDNVGRNLKSKQCEAFFGDLDGTEVKKGNEDHYNPYSEQGFPEECTDQFYEGTRLDEWVHAEAEKYHTSVKQKHQRELEDLEEQIRKKDEKLESYHWQLVNAEVESKRLQYKVEVLNQELFQLQDNNLRLESLSVEREREIKALKDQITGMQWNSLNAQKSRKHSSKREILVDNDITGYLAKLNKITKKKTGEKDQKSEKKEEGNEPECLSKHTSSTSFSSVEEVEEEKEEVEANTVGLNKMNNASHWKVDLHALGVTYKIKRLNQQLLMLDRLTGKQESNEFKNFSVLLSLLKKQVGRYQSLHEKTDNLSKQMDEKNLNVKRGTSKRAKEETRNLEHFLEETFQLQRFIVATGQKLMEVQSKIGSGFVDEIATEFEGVANFDMKRFGDTMQSLFKDVQRGLEVRISRIIGDLEGTLAYDGIHFLK